MQTTMLKHIILYHRINSLKSMLNALFYCLEQIFYLVCFFNANFPKYFACKNQVVENVIYLVKIKHVGST